MKNIILKIACLLISLGQLNAQNSLGKTDDSGRIVLNVSLEEEIIDKSVTKIFENRLKSIVSLNGFGGNKSYPRFVITGDVDELTKEVASTTNPLYVLTLNFNLYIGDAIAGTVFSSESIEIKGIGNWTVDMFLIFTRGSSNIFPTGDLGFIKAISKHYKKDLPLDHKFLSSLLKRWSPYSSVATWYLWRSLDPIPVSY